MDSNSVQDCQPDKSCMKKITDQISNELLHYIKGVGKHALSTYLEYLLQDSEKWCPFSNHKEESNLNCYYIDERIKYLFLILNNYAKILKYIESKPYFHQELREMIREVEEPQTNIEHQDFNSKILYIKTRINQHEEEIYAALQSFTCLECIRLDEALVCFDNDCYLSSIIMAISAVEARIRYLLETKDKVLYQSEFSRNTLGQLIQLFDDTQYKDEKYKNFKELLPKKHLSLIGLLNNYRIITAHPLSGSIDYKLAESVLNLTFNFLMDDQLAIIDTALLACD